MQPAFVFPELPLGTPASIRTGNNASMVSCQGPSTLTTDLSHTLQVIVLNLVVLRHGLPYVAQVGLELIILLPQPSECYYYK